MLEPRTIETAGAVALIAILAGFVALVSHLAVQPYLAAERDLTAYRRAVEILSTAEGGVAELEDQIRLVREAVARSEALLPRTVNLDGFLDELGEAAREAGVRVEQLTPHEVDVQPRFRQIPIDARVTGSYLSIYAFLQTIESGGQLARVEHLRIVATPGSSACAAELSLLLYFAPQERA